MINTEKCYFCAFLEKQISVLDTFALRPVVPVIKESICKEGYLCNAWKAKGGREGTFWRQRQKLQFLILAKGENDFFHEKDDNG